jgi:hypothetical protein
MNQTLQERIVFGLLMAVGATLLILLYGPVLFHPDRYMFSTAGDGIKNYFTFAWHVRYDADWIHFGGVNYPFGDHVGYTDGHPLFSGLLGQWDLVKKHPVGFINFCCALSPLLAVAVLYFLLLRCQVNAVLAALGALCIVALNPQIDRISGHFALSYAWVIPLFFLLLFKAIEKNTFLLHGLLAVYTGLVFFIHPYLGMGLCLFAMGFALLTIIKNKFQKSEARTLWWPAALIGLALPLGYMLFTKWTDGHADRPAAAGGFMEYKANFASVFLSGEGPMKLLLDFLNIQPQFHWEGAAYIGMGTMLVAVMALFFFFVKKEKPSLGVFPKALICGSLPLLLFSFAWPFVWKLESLLHALPIVQQFRAPGRFAWFFFYAVNIGAVVMLQYFWSQHRKTGWVLLAMYLFLFVWESVPRQMRLGQRMQSEPNLFSQEFLPESWKKKVDALHQDSTLTAIIALPFFHYGSDVFQLNASDKAKSEAFVLAFHSQLPLANSSDPRASLSESRQQLNLFSSPQFLLPYSTVPAPNWAVVRCEDEAIRAQETWLWERSSTTQHNNIHRLSHAQWLTGQADYNRIVEAWSSVQLADSALIRMTLTDSILDIDKGQYQIIGECLLDSSATRYWVEVDLFSENTLLFPHTLLILEQEDENNKGQWKVVQTAASNSGLPDNVYRLGFFAEGLYPNKQIRLIAHHNNWGTVTASVLRCELIPAH